MEIKKTQPVTVTAIFDYLKSIQSKSDNPFEVDKVNEPFDAFCKKHLPANNARIFNEGYMELCGLIHAAEEKTLSKSALTLLKVF